jgi:hypothetical protein
MANMAVHPKGTPCDEKFVATCRAHLSEQFETLLVVEPARVLLTP